MWIAKGLIFNIANIKIIILYVTFNKIIILLVKDKINVS